MLLFGISPILLLLLNLKITFVNSEVSLTLKSKIDNPCPLEAMGEELQVDKFNDHRYHTIYCPLFEPIKHHNLSMLEIGFGCGHHVNGRSALLWKRYFKHLSYYSIDYLPLPRYKGYNGEDCINKFNNEYPNHGVEKIWFGDQANATFLRQVVREYKDQWDIIIDDGGHFKNQQRISFQQLWPHVKPGGYYIVEDIHMVKYFSTVVSKWMKPFCDGEKEVKYESDKFIRVIPKGIETMGCGYQICYFRKS